MSDTDDTHDTHGESGEGWYGFDLDGTLARYDGWKGIDHIGEPIKPMVDLIKRLHAEGKVVKIMTARVAPREKTETARHELSSEVPAYARGQSSDPNLQAWYDAMYLELVTWRPLEFIVDWCFRNLGFSPPVVYQKDHLMLELYDDRVKQVIPNEGVLVEDVAASRPGVIKKPPPLAEGSAGWLLCCAGVVFFLFGVMGGLLLAGLLGL